MGWRLDGRAFGLATEAQRIYVTEYTEYTEGM